MPSAAALPPGSVLLEESANRQQSVAEVRLATVRGNDFEPGVIWSCRTQRGTAYSRARRSLGSAWLQFKTLDKLLLSAKCHKATFPPLKMSHSRPGFGKVARWHACDAVCESVMSSEPTGLFLKCSPPLSQWIHHHPSQPPWSRREKSLWISCQTLADGWSHSWTYCSAWPTVC